MNDMNKQRRKQIADVLAKIPFIWSDLDDLKSEIEAIRDEEQEAFDNMPASLQMSEKGEMAQECIDHLESALSAAEDAVNACDEAQSALESVE